MIGGDEAERCGGNGGVLADSTSLNNFVVRIKKDFPEYKFFNGKRFTFRPPRTIILEPVTGDWEQIGQYELSVLHELGHALLEHKFYTTDPERLRMEREAWERARELCPHYGVEYDEEYVEQELDTYRDWLHRKSGCPKCGLTRYQTRDGRYHCPSCEG